MTFIICAVVWYLIGFFALLRTLWEIEPTITIRDLIVCSFSGVIGPVAILLWLVHSPRDLLNKRIF